jgi:RimJ/RimL family protein N-acetyltransferase
VQPKNVIRGNHDMTTTALPELRTARLALRPRTVADLDLIAALNADPEVMRYIAPVGDPAMGRDGIAARSFSHVARGLSYWSVFPLTAARDLLGQDLLGYVGLIPDGDAHEQVQISYRFAARHWGKGHAFEAVTRLLRHGFETLALPEIAIVTHPENAASLRLATKLGFEPVPARLETLIGAPPVVATRMVLRRASFAAASRQGAR